MKLRTLLESLITESEYQKGQTIWVKGPASGLSKSKFAPVKIISYFGDSSSGRSTGSSDSLYMTLELPNKSKIDIFQGDKKKYQFSKTDPAPVKIPKVNQKYFGEKDLLKVLKGMRSDSEGDNFDVDEYGTANDLVDNLLHDKTIVNYVANAIRRQYGNMNMSVKYSDIKEYLLSRL